MSAPRVLLLVRHRGNRRRLEEWARDAMRAEVVGAPDAEIDFVVADAAAFVEERASIDALRTGALPVFLPCLLVCSPREAPRMPHDVWRTADDVVVTPIRPDELRIRVERLTTRRAGTLALDEQRVELQRSNVDLERFAFVAAHELVTPLSIVNGAVRTVAARYANHDEAATAVLDAAVDGCERMRMLIDDILDLSRAGQRRAEGVVDTHAVVEDVRDELRERLAAAGASVSYDELPVVKGDASQLRLLFRNLIANAVKYRRPDAPPAVEIEATREGDAWQFCVADNGVGIPETEREAVFGLFARSSTQADASGTGIGLAICRRVVEQLGGRIWVEPRDGGPGSRFCFVIPG